MVSLDTFCWWADEMVDQLPERFLWELNGGVMVSEEEHRRACDPPGVYLLGEYIVDEYLGRLIMIYYGSFGRVFAGEPEELVRRELWDTVLHEVRHHLEDLAGIDDLNEEDRLVLEGLRHEFGAHGETGPKAGSE